MKIKITSAQSSFARYEWQSIPEEPGLLYISDFEELQGGKLELKMYKVYKLKVVTKTPIVLLEDDCYGAMVGGNCFDRRDVKFESAKGPWWAVVFGESVQEAGGRQQYIVSEKQGPIAEHSHTGFSIEELIADLNRNPSYQKFGWFKIGAKEKFSTGKYQNNFVDTAGLADAKVTGLQGFKPLHVDQVYSWGFQIVEKEFLDKLKSANWFVYIDAQKGAESVTAILGGSGAGFQSEKSGSTFYSETNPFPTPRAGFPEYRGFRSDSGHIMVSKCGTAIDKFLDAAPWSTHLKPATKELEGCEAAKPELLRALYDSGWQQTHEYWLESWHSIL